MTAKRPGVQMVPIATSLDDGTLYRQPGQRPGIVGLQDESDAFNPGHISFNPGHIFQLLPVMFTEKQCGRFFAAIYSPELADFSDYKVELTLIYTDGKDHHWSHWPTSTAMGLMTGAFLIPRSRIAAGGAIIDLRACAQSAGAGIPSISISLSGQTSIHMRQNLTLGKLRWKVLSVLAHEMFHMIQNWRGGNTYSDNELYEPTGVRYTETYNRILDQIAREKPNLPDEDLKGIAHATHPSEREAEQFAMGRLNHYREWIENGGWDECLPVDALEKYL